MRCLDGWTNLLRRGGNVIEKTPMEQQAIKDARRFLAQALGELRLLEAFQNCTPVQIDQVIEACVDGFQASMQRQANEKPQSLDDPIPF